MLLTTDTTDTADSGVSTPTGGAEVGPAADSDEV